MGIGRCVGIPETVLASAAAVEVTGTAAVAAGSVPVAVAMGAPATFEATAPSSVAADCALAAA